MHVILAIDPGETTGCASCTAEGLLFSDLKVADIVDLLKLEQFVGWAMVGYPNCVCVVESFNLFPHKARAQIGSNFPSAEVIGVMKYFAQRWDRRLVFQTPAQKEVIKDSMLKDCFHLEVLPTSPHIKDAMRHILFFTLKDYYGTV